MNGNNTMKHITLTDVKRPDGSKVTLSAVLGDRAQIPSGDLWLMPAFIDLHCHLRDPGLEYKEDIHSGTRAAAAGGCTAVVCMPNTKPATDSAEVLDYIANKAKTASCAVLPCAAITEGQNGEKLVDFLKLTEHGAVAFSDDGKPVENPAMMLEAMQIAAANDLLIMSHPEEPRLSKGGSVNAGQISEKLGIPGIDPLAEEAAIARDMLLAEAAGCRLHLCHVSTARAVQLIREAKARGVKVTAETCPHYFTFTEDELLVSGTHAKMNPPLRKQADIDGIIEGIADGTIDCISTDHAPHSREEKALPLDKAPSGIIGVQTMFASCVTQLVRPGIITMQRLSEMMSLNPRKVLGRFADRAPEKYVLCEISKPYTLTEDMLKGKSNNTPLIGHELYGTVVECESLSV